MPSTPDRLLAVLGGALVVATGATAILAPGGRSATQHGPAVTARGTTTAVTIQGYAFAPATLRVRSGTRVSFTNRDNDHHTATAMPGSGFDTGTLSQGQTRTVTLSKPGTYSYICEFHAFMHGTIVVG